jgi:hypothetical protein
MARRELDQTELYAKSTAHDRFGNGQGDAAIAGFANKSSGDIGLCATSGSINTRIEES